SSWGIWNVASYANMAYQQRRVRARLVLPRRATPVDIRAKQLHRVSVVYASQGWGIRIPFTIESGEAVNLSNGRRLQGSRWNTGAEHFAVLEGNAAIQAASKLLPAINESGAKRDEVQSAVSIIEEANGAASLFSRYATRMPSDPKHPFAPPPVPGHTLSRLPKEVRLALEMATHEDSERRALEGELSVLEAAWKEAEEIAAIADDLFVPEETAARLARLKPTEPPD